MKRLEFDLNELPYSIEEAMNKLRINVRFTGKNVNKIMFTSSLPEEGKSSISIYLWKMLVEAGYPSVFVDADLRKSILKTRYNMSVKEDKSVDLGYFLSGEAEYEDVVYETNYENGYFVPCFHTLENPSTLFEDERFEELLNRLSDEYKYVIIDTPPLQLVSDGMQIAKYCDGAILVVKAGSTSRSVIKASIKSIEQVGCPLIGSVLNQVEQVGRSYSKHYGKYSKYGSYSSYYRSTE